jgi:hypothetical protein
MPSVVNKVLAEGRLTTSETTIFTATKETVIKLFRVTNEGSTYQSFAFAHNNGKGLKIPITNLIRLVSKWVVDVFHDGQELSLQPGEFITGYSDIDGAITYIVSGQEISYNIQGG